MRVAARVSRVEVIPNRDPVEVECLDARPQFAQLGDRRVLQTGMDSEAHVHRRGSYNPRVYPDDVITVDHWPQLHEPVLVVALQGWVDAGMAGAGAIDVLRD